MFTLFLLLLLINVFLISFMIFFEHKRPFRVVVWMLVFTLLPFLGFIFYIFLGLGVTNKTKKMKKVKNYSTFAYNYSLKKQFEEIDENCKKIKSSQKPKVQKLETQKSKVQKLEKQPKTQLETQRETQKFNLILHKSLVIENESIEIFRSGESAFLEIKKTLQKAKKSIFLSTYIFADDNIGGEIKEILLEKLKSGVKVFVLYDSFGSKKTKKSFFEQIKQNGGYVFEFFPSFWKINLKINYRNHKKIIVIDENVSFIGGLNIRDDHLGRDKKLSSWVDTHLKIVGKTSLGLLETIVSDIKLCNFSYDFSKISNEIFCNQNYFLLKQSFVDNKKIVSNGNYNSNEYYNSNKNYDNNEKIKNKEIDKDINIDNTCKKKNVDSNENFDNRKKCQTQVVLSSPLDYEKNIEDSLLFLINNCKEEIVIETPYLILDDKFMSSLKLALIRGVKVKIFIPKLVDKKFVYNATLFYAQKLCLMGAEVFKVNAFLHSKTMLVDKNILVCGSSNFDMRSFYLNFEASCIIYDKEVCERFCLELAKNEKTSEKFSLSSYKKLPVVKKLAISFAKLFSPLL